MAVCRGFPPRPSSRKFPETGHSDAGNVGILPRHLPENAENSLHNGGNVHLMAPDGAPDGIIPVCFAQVRSLFIKHRTCSRWFRYPVLLSSRSVSPLSSWPQAVISTPCGRFPCSIPELSRTLYTDTVINEWPISGQNDMVGISKHSRRIKVWPCFPSQGVRMSSALPT